ncbi:hypothetical protein D9757_000962 [Collybiopsis confluens]|uniref:Asl1-like glycosyl hydrolase catalytic domain-containing protein n=1 Tax=Collybiopsis confluens TaxID=2823264 RepID=A0A8H5I136_9AGAR|nr:hypothetical protein D9757_000962 [Collybiopsis confluens]
MVVQLGRYGSGQAASGIHFVPMQWGKNGMESFQAKVQTTKANYVLGLNEPERFDQANMSVAAAVQLFEQHPLRSQGIKVSAPAVSSAPEGQAWIKAFAQQRKKLMLYPRSPMSGDPRFPNEIFILIKEHLDNDRPSLRSLALVCKDFAIMAQSNAKLLRFIRRSHISDIRGVFNGGDSAHILRNMTALSVLNSCNPESSHFGAIESSSLPLTLKVLYIARLDAADVDSFANTLLSLKSLEALAINGVRAFQNIPLPSFCLAR